MSIQTAYQKFINALAANVQDTGMTQEDVTLIRQAYVAFERELRDFISAPPPGVVHGDTIIPTREPVTVGNGAYTLRVYLTEYHNMMADVFVRGPGYSAWRRVDHITTYFSEAGAQQMMRMMKIYGFRQRVIVG